MKLLTAWALLAIALAGALAGRLTVAGRNTLERHGDWLPSKLGVERELLGARSYWQGRQALDGGMLDLGAWHGFQEVLHRDLLEPASVRVDFFLTSQAWLAVLLYDAQESDFAGVRLSLRKPQPSALLAGSREGGFERLERLGAELGAGTRHRLELRFAAGRLEATLDGRALEGALPVPPGPLKLGLRGGFRPAFVDDVRVREIDGRGLRERFGLPDRAVATALGGAALALLLALGLALVMRRIGRVSPRHVAAWGAMMGSSLAIALVILTIYVAGRPAGYPRAGAALRLQEQRDRESLIQQTSRRLKEDWTGPRRPGTFRILAVGSSQTWGSGARRAEDTWVARLERLLEAARPGLDVECINAGIPSATAPRLARVLEKRWLAVEPDLLVVDLANNDKDAVALGAAIERMIDAARAHGVEVALIPEPNSPERRESGLGFRRGTMARIAAERGVLLVEMQGHLAARQDAGFLWWDKVHLTSFGNRLFAERLAAELVAGGLVEPVG